MSGRIRTVKPELLEDAVTAAISSDAFRLYVGAILLSDDHGNFRAEPRKLLGDVFWARSEVTVETVKTLLTELAEAGRSPPSKTGLFGLYRVRDQLYGHIRNWEKHQKVDKVGNPRCPKPDDREAVQCSPDVEFSRVRRETLAPDPDPDHDPDQDRPDGRLSGVSAPDVSSVASNVGLSGIAPSAPTLSLLPDQPDSTKPERDVFEYWVAGWKRIVGGIRTPRLDDKRRAKIRSRLREGFTVEDLKRAVDGLWASTWHIANKRHDIELVCRDTSHVEDFMGRAPAIGPAASGTMAISLPEPDPVPHVALTAEQRSDAAKRLAAIFADDDLAKLASGDDS